MIIFYYYKEDTCTCKLNWNNIVFPSSTIDDYMYIYNDSMIQKHE